ncbi:hypothetical protein Y032_0250g134 [Ancylostoma ceylanicum]|uniref:Uncharacterized protein n=1 Tax=Ancylostoma ceylanicum TaxID=53326 RepID=A0A016SC65_9BILA|nr:hypothetical protein Y032_0250g134 [Ancylostoma ceylanicum]
MQMKKKLSLAEAQFVAGYVIIPDIIRASAFTTLYLITLVRPGFSPVIGPPEILVKTFSRSVCAVLQISMKKNLHFALLRAVFVARRNEGPFAIIEVSGRAEADEGA